MDDRRDSRRGFLQRTIGGGLAMAGVTRDRWPAARAATPTAADSVPPVRVITGGPKHHWFGYYDKLEFDPTHRWVLGMEVDFEHRSPRPDDPITVGMVDLAEHDRWIPLGTSTAWGWQQGCMLQWIPGSRSEVLWNDREEGQYVCRILNTQTRQLRTMPHPIYALSPDGRTAVAADFRRINDVRPGYGYAGLADPLADDLSPKASGVFRVDLITGQRKLIVSLAEVAAMGRIPKAKPGIKHYVNHLLFNPDGSRFVFLHRWRYPDGTRLTRMFTAAPDGTDLRIVDDNGLTSHFIWRDPRHILAYSDQPTGGRGFYLFEDGGDARIEPVGIDAFRADGHVSYLPGAEWILSDTYPDGQRNQNPFLVHVPSGRVVSLGKFRSPPPYGGEWRCDTHPRFSPDGRSVVIDSPHRGDGRQLHLIDISGIVGQSRE